MRKKFKINTQSLVALAAFTALPLSSANAAFPTLAGLPAPVNGITSTTFDPNDGSPSDVDTAANKDGGLAADIKLHIPANYAANYSIPEKTGFDVVFLFHGTEQTAGDALNAVSGQGWLRDAEKNKGVIYIALSSGISRKYQAYANANNGGTPVRRWDTASGLNPTGNGDGCDPTNMAYAGGVAGVGGYTVDRACWSDHARILDIKNRLMAQNYVTINGSSVNKLSGRFYAFGFSNGAVMANHLICYQSDAFQGFGVMAGTLSKVQYDSTCGEADYATRSATGTLAQKVAYSMYTAINKQAVKFGGATGNKRSIYYGCGTQDPICQGDLFLNGGYDQDTAYVDPLGIMTPYLLTSTARDDRSMYSWYKNRLNTQTAFQSVTDYVGPAISLPVAGVCNGASCTMLTGTDNSSVPYTSGINEYITSVEFQSVSAAGSNNSLAHLQMRGGEHHVPPQAPGPTKGYTNDFSALDRMVLFMKAKAGLVAVPN